jgi:hypothetical protein
MHSLFRLQMVHPYLQEHLKHAVRAEPAQEGRNSPARGAPGTPPAAPTGPPTPGANGADHGSEVAIGTPPKAATPVSGKDDGAPNADSAHNARQPSAREASVECSSLANSLDDRCMRAQPLIPLASAVPPISVPASRSSVPTRARADYQTGADCCLLCRYERKACE